MMSNLNVSKWIFVTGAPRSGTTFLGKILSTPISVDYIHEPFNPECGIPSIDQRFLYLSSGDSQEKSLPYHLDIERLFSYRNHLKTGIFVNDPPWKKIIKRIIGSRGPFYYRLAKINPFHKSAVIKDPIGCFLTDYLAQVYSVMPVIIIRHPVATVSSMLRLGWTAENQLNVNDILKQTNLTEKYLSDEDIEIHRNNHDPLISASLIWRYTYKVLIAMSKDKPNWIFITHERLSSNPHEAFYELFRNLDLPWSQNVVRTISNLTNSENPIKSRGGKTQDFKRNSSEINNNSKNLLSVEERRMIFDLTHDIFPNIYPISSYWI